MRRRRAVSCAALTAVLLAAATAPSAQAKTCADYPDQASAQRAADTRDADGDGIYCESLPCPCLKPGSSNPAPAPKPKAKSGPARPKLGTPVKLHPRSKGSGCMLRGSLPDPDCTPGAYYPLATKRVICRTGYSATVRHVPENIKGKVYAEYGISHHTEGEYEIDHLVPLEVGGSNSLANLFAEPAAPPPGFHEKDRLEDAIRAGVCDRGDDLRLRQRQVARDWVSLFDKLVS